MPTVADILKANGMSDADIAKIDSAAMAHLGKVLDTASIAETKARELNEQAALENRAAREMWDQKVSPALDRWGNEKANIEAERDYYKRQAQGAKEAGFIAKDAPGYQPPAGGAGQPQGSDGRYVSGAGTVPGSPTYMTKEEGMRAVTNGTWYVTEHMRLHGAPPPDDIETLAAEAERNKMPFREWVSKKYKFDERKAEIVATKRKEQDDKLVADTIAARDKFWAERGAGSNPGVRQGAESQFTKLRAGVDQKQIQDPLMMTKGERHAQTSQLIQKDIAENAVAAVH